MGRIHQIAMRLVLSGASHLKVRVLLVLVLHANALATPDEKSVLLGRGTSQVKQSIADQSVHEIGDSATSCTVPESIRVLTNALNSNLMNTDPALKKTQSLLKQLGQSKQKATAVAKKKKKPAKKMAKQKGKSVKKMAKQKATVIAKKGGVTGNQPANSACKVFSIGIDKTTNKFAVCGKASSQTCRGEGNGNGDGITAAANIMEGGNCAVCPVGYDIGWKYWHKNSFTCLNNTVDNLKNPLVKHPLVCDPTRMTDEVKSGVTKCVNNRMITTCKYDVVHFSNEHPRHGKFVFMNFEIICRGMKITICKKQSSSKQEAQCWSQKQVHFEKLTLLQAKNAKGTLMTDMRILIANKASGSPKFMNASDAAAVADMQSRIRAGVDPHALGWQEMFLKTTGMWHQLIKYDETKNICSNHAQNF